MPAPVLITCRICERQAEAHPAITDMCVFCGETDWYALSNGIAHVMQDGTLYDPDIENDSKFNPGEE